MFRFLNVGLDLKGNFLVLPINVREWGKIWEKQFSRVLLTHDLHWEYKPYKLKRSFTKLLLTKLKNIQSSYLQLGFQRQFQLFYVL